MAGEGRVVLNVYDLLSSPEQPGNLSDVLYYCGLGVFHSGIEIYGVEYAYGGHEYDASGVFATNPKDAPGPVVFRESIDLGETELSPDEVQELVHRLGEAYRGNRYHLLQRNCNHFASDLCYHLTGARPPHWVNRLANLAVMLHCLLPTSWVPPLTPPTAAPDLSALTSPDRLGDSDQARLLTGPSSTPVPQTAFA